MEQVIYILSTVVLFILCMLLKKKDEKVNFIKYMAINIVLFLCYNSAICLLLSTIGIPITLATLSVTNIIMSIIILFIIIKQKSIQQYIIKSKDIIATIIICIIAISTALLNFTSQINIKYIMTDASVHYKAARVFYQNDKLLNKIEDTDLDKQFMTGAYTNTGILFKIFEPLLGEVNLYKIFILFDISIYLLVGLMLYLLIEKLIKNKFSYILSLLFITLFMIGYPLNSLIYGFVYLQLGILIIETIVLIFQEIDEKFNKKIATVILFLLNFGVFFSYLILVPVIYATEGIYLLMRQYKENKKYFSKKNIFVIFISLVIPFIIGMLYFAVPNLQKMQSNEVFVTVEGYIYRNYWSNFIFLIPIAVMCFKNKNKDVQFLEIMFITLILMMIVMFVAVKTINFSTYYYCKYNFLLWFVLWYGIMYSMNTFDNQKDFRYAITLFTLVYSMFTIIFIYRGTPITKEIWPKETILNAFDIYGTNRTIIKNVVIDYTQEEMELLQYVYDNIDVKTNKILILGNPRQEYWFDGIFSYKNREDLQSIIPKSDIYKWNDNKEFKYALVLYSSYAYEEYKDIFDEKEILYKNNSGIIYENQ